jgi:GAF domain-containing protein
MELPPNEAERLAALVNYGILDTEFEESFDRVTRIAANVFEVPIALVSLIDGYRQWFKSAVGLKVRETPREISFCTHAIMGSELFIVADASCDSRFSANPLVTSDPNIRFYAGAPLIDHEGYALGTMCVIDRAPRAAMSNKQQAILTDLAGIIVDLMEARRLRRTLARHAATIQTP